MMLMPYKTDAGHWQWINMVYFFPWGAMTDERKGKVVRAIGENARKLARQKIKGEMARARKEAKTAAATGVGAE